MTLQILMPLPKQPLAGVAEPGPSQGAGFHSRPRRLGSPSGGRRAGTAARAGGARREQ
jgi:hypothetical protein